MTQKSFYQYVASHIDNDEVKAMAQAWLDKQDAKSAVKKSENEAYEAAILEVLGGVDNPVTAAEIGAEIGVTTAKAASLLKGMRAMGTVACNEEIKGNKVARTYFLA